jgi:hypothetical protein
MQIQNYNNHRRYVIAYHFILYGLAIIALIASFINFFRAVTGGSNLFNSGIFVLLSVSLCMLTWYARLFALRAHDKAIRAEENLRHYVLTGKLLDKELRMSQITALRFAPDEELAALAKKAVEEKLSNDEIKKQVRNWKPDHNRV